MDRTGTAARRKEVPVGPSRLKSITFHKYFVMQYPCHLKTIRNQWGRRWQGRKTWLTLGHLLSALLRGINQVSIVMYNLIVIHASGREANVEPKKVTIT